MSSVSTTKKRRWIKPTLIASGVVIVLTLGFWLWLPANGLPTARKFIRWKFDDVSHTTPAELATRLGNDNHTPTLLWDVRRADEFSVSHLPNAIRVSPETTDVELKDIIPENNQPIIVYCSVGYRSAKMALRLKALGHTNVSNLEGAIFAWATEGHPLEGGNTVHPYNTFGRRMLANELEAE